eukprot:Nk52_evm11s319 gene=Nk52_evmTU11s319
MDESESYMNEEEYVAIVNVILSRLNLQRHVTVHSLRDCTVSLFVALFETLFAVRLPEIIRRPVTMEDRVHNARVLLNRLSVDILGMDLGHINAEVIAHGAVGGVEGSDRDQEVQQYGLYKNNVVNLIEILFELLCIMDESGSLLRETLKEERHNKKATTTSPPTMKNIEHQEEQTTDVEFRRLPSPSSAASMGEVAQGPSYYDRKGKAPMYAASSTDKSPVYQTGRDRRDYEDIGDVREPAEEEKQALLKGKIEQDKKKKSPPTPSVRVPEKTKEPIKLFERETGGSGFANYNDSSTSAGGTQEFNEMLEQLRNINTEDKFHNDEEGEDGAMMVVGKSRKLGPRSDTEDGTLKDDKFKKEILEQLRANRKKVAVQSDNYSPNSPSNGKKSRKGHGRLGGGRVFFTESEVRHALPKLGIPIEASNAMYKKQILYWRELLNKESTKHPDRFHDTLNEIERKQQYLLKLLRREIEHTRRLQRVKEEAERQQALKKCLYRKRHRQAMTKHYYTAYDQEFKSRNKKRTSREELVFKRCFDVCLQIQKEQLREEYKYAKEKRQEREKMQSDALESLVHYYKDQYEMLSEKMKQERRDIHTSAKAQKMALEGMKRELKRKLEREIGFLQSNLYNDQDIAHFRRLDADKLVRSVIASTR